MTTTSLLPHKPPLKTRNPVFLRTSYYGSVGRPSNGRRKSAVELLQETKAFYVKSESVLDTKQELKNTDHLHVRSPTVDVSSHYRSNTGNGGSVLPFFPIGTCPSYPHHHFEHYEHAHLQREFENFVQQHVNRDNKDSFRISKTSSMGKATTNVISTGTNTLGGNNKSRSSAGTKTTSSTRRSTLPPGTLHLHIHMQKDVSNSGSNIIGLPFPFPVGQQQISSSSSPRTGVTIEKHAPSTLPVITSAASAVPNHGGVKVEDNPPPLPPKSPRTASKPVRPQDFPQRLPVQGMPPNIQPPPPPRRLMSHENDHHHESHNIQSKLRRLLHDGPGGIIVSSSSISAGGDPNLSVVPVTLPSPILPPTPPPDITMESPMSDSGPIISPPPAFSTPVTPMLDRQNSSASDKSTQKHHPLSAAMSMVSVSISSISSSRNSRKSIPDLSDASMRYSPHSRSSPDSSPMSPDDADGEEEDDDSSGKAPISKTKKTHTNHNQQQQKKIPIPKSVTEIALCKVSNLDSGTPPRVPSHSNEGSKMSPIRRPILRSKSDLSHRYIKSGSSSNLITGGFTLVHVDLGIPPPPPPHQNAHHTTHHYHHGSNQTETVGDSYSSTRDSPNLGKKRCSKSSLELERFFDKLGLENSTPPPVLPVVTTGGGNPGDRSGGSSPVFFSSVSSVDSGPRRGGSIDSGDSPLGVKVGSRTVGGGGYNAPVATTSGSNIIVQHGEPSIVERNARVIKWLFNCRKAVDKR